MMKLVTCKELLFNSKMPDKFKEKYSFTPEYMSKIESDNSSNLRGVRTQLKKLEIKNASLQDAEVVKEICRLVSTRATIIAASLISATVEKIDPEFRENHTIAVDGSIFEKYYLFKERRWKMHL